MEPSSGNEPRTRRREEPASPVRFRGVRMRGAMWVAEVRLPRSRRKLWLGTYADAEKAARAYDAAVYCLRGPDAALNFPERRPDISSASSLSPAEIRAAAMAHAHDGPRRPVDQAGPAEWGEAGRTEPPLELGESSPIFSPEFTPWNELPEDPRSDDGDTGGFDSTLWNFSN